MIGTTLAHYEILAKIGEGGMGEVWKARDTTLNREVAIKVLPEIFAQDPDRRARFEREAQLLAQLNHPGIAAVHGLHEDGGRHFLAMELVPGEDLAHRLARGPLPVDEALKVGARVAEALEAAHERGVIHRDLKPSNIVLMPGGAAKVLDFGLAKSVDPGSARDSDLSASPTMTTPGTMEGVILGTAAYMSPEQARGKPLDRRTDIWSFGCVLYECLTGRTLFKGETVSDTIGAILHREPDWGALPAETPAPVVLLLRRCLTRDADQRLRDIGDARLELIQAIQDPTGSYLGLSIPGNALEAPGRRGRSAWILGSVLGLVGIGLGIAAGILLRPSPEPLPLRKLDLGVTIEAPDEDVAVAEISPDGTRVVFSHRDRLWVQFLDQMDPHPLEGTEGAHGPTWSPDGTQIAYFNGSRLWRVPATGGRSTAIADMGEVTAGGFGADWTEDGRIVYSRGNTGLFAVSARGGEPREILPLDEGDGDFHEPCVLPGDQGIVFVLHPDMTRPNTLCAARDGARKVLFTGESEERLWDPVYSSSGHILFRRTPSGAVAGVWALPFDAGSLEVTGEAFLVAQDGASPSVSDDGTLVLVSGVSESTGNEQLFWADRTGRLLEPVGTPRHLGDVVAFSPDGKLLAFSYQDEENGDYDLWVRDMDRGVETRITRNPRFEFGYVWSPDGRDLFFGEFFPSITVGEFKSWRASPDGSGEPAVVAKGSVESFDPQRNALIMTHPAGPDSAILARDLGSLLMRVPLDGNGEAEPVLKGSGTASAGGVLSPRGDLIVYESWSANRSDIFLSRYPEGTGRWKVSIREGGAPVWDPRGDRFYYVEGNADLMEVMVDRSGETVNLSRPTLLFQLPSGGYTPAPDGERFLIVAQPVQGSEEVAVEPRMGIKLVANWIREFEER